MPPEAETDNNLIDHHVDLDDGSKSRPLNTYILAHGAATQNDRPLNLFIIRQVYARAINKIACILMPLLNHCAWLFKPLLLYPWTNIGGPKNLPILA